jgi:hypothetical protein
MATAVVAEQRIPFTFDHDTHIYRVQGQRILSVTQIIKESGLINFDFVDAHVLARKTQLGRLVHQACHFYDENDLPSALPEEVEARLEGYIKFRKESGYVPACNEFQQIASVHGMRYGMQFDSIGTIGELPYLVDIKNSATAHPAWGVQTAAYELGIPKPLPFRNYQRIAVQLKDDATYRVHTYKEPSDAQIFLSCLAIATWKQNKKLSAA